MDRITASLLADYSREYGIEHLRFNQRFEHLAAHVTVRRHYSKTFDVADIITSVGNDTGIDAVAILVNSILITDIDVFKEHAEQASRLDVSFIFVQAESGAGFEGTTIGNFGFGVRDYFSMNPTLRRNDAISKAAEIISCSATTN